MAAGNDPDLSSLKADKTGVRYYPLKTFLDREFIHFAVYDNLRALPSSVDGLVPSRRKILWAMLGRKNEEMKVSQLTGYVSMKSSYHHGEASLTQTMIKMAWDFVGSNNVPLLVPIGQFGSRLLNGADHAAARYIFTKLSPLARLAFPAEDDPLLEATVEDGAVVEPKHYCPIIPMVFANGAVGIGTGYACNIPTYSPRDLIDLVRKKLDKPKGSVRKELLAMRPDAVGFQGNTGIDKTGKAYSNGKFTVHQMPKTGRGARTQFVIRITELPLYQSIENFRHHLDHMVEHKQITGYEDLSSGTSVDMDVFIQKELALEWHNNGTLLTKFGLHAGHPVNATVVDAHNVIRAYNTDFEPILEEYFERRYALYKKRREYLLVEVGKDIIRVVNLIKFSKLVRGGNINLVRLEAEQLDKVLRKHKFQTDPDADDYNYITDRKLFSLTKTNLERLEEKHEQLKRRKKQLEAATPKSLWVEDLTKFEQAFTQFEATQVETIQKELTARVVSEPVDLSSYALKRDDADADIAQASDDDDSAKDKKKSRKSDFVGDKEESSKIGGSKGGARGGSARGRHGRDTTVAVDDLLAGLPVPAALRRSIDGASKRAKRAPATPAKKPGKGSRTKMVSPAEMVSMATLLATRRAAPLLQRFAATWRGLFLF